MQSSAAARARSVDAAPALGPRISQRLGSAAEAVRAAATAPDLDDVARWCAAFDGGDPRLQLAALREARDVIIVDALVTDVIAALRARLQVAGPHLATIAARGDLPRLLIEVGLDDATPPDHALVRRLPPRLARHYWRRWRAYVAWIAARNWPTAG